jgi:hypothetical protein
MNHFEWKLTRQLVEIPTLNGYLRDLGYNSLVIINHLDEMKARENENATPTSCQYSG